jgi:hypothetical protein
VLLAILAGAGLLALAPALVRRYDADERIAAEREQSQARVLERKARHGSTQPGSMPLNPPLDNHSEEDDEDDESLLNLETPPEPEPETDDPGRTGWERSGARRAASVRWSPTPTESQGQEEHVASARTAWWQRRYRRVLYVLLALNLAELVGVVAIGPGFWVGVAVSAALLVAFLRFLRQRVVRQTTARPAITSGDKPEVYVPAQAEGDFDDAPAADDDDPPDGFVPGFGPGAEEEPTEPEPAPSRRRTGGIRGRSYESPANL